MSDELKVGDRVTWKPKYQSKKIPKTLTGEVRKLHGGRKPWAAVWVDMVDRPGFWCVDLSRLTRVPDSDTVAAQDDYLGTLSVAADPFALLGESEDVEVQMRWANSLS